MTPRRDRIWIAASGSWYQPVNEYMEWIRSFGNRVGDYGMLVYDIDSLQRYCLNDRVAVIETKCHNVYPKHNQSDTLELIDAMLSVHNNYVGTYLFRFENTSPINGVTSVHKLLNGSWVDQGSFNAAQLDTYIMGIFGMTQKYDSHEIDILRKAFSNHSTLPVLTQ
jgi:hypothetical protein